jgi:hypothetical protein
VGTLEGDDLANGKPFKIARILSSPACPGVVCCTPGPLSHHLRIMLVSKTIVLSKISLPILVDCKGIPNIGSYLFVARKND